MSTNAQGHQFFYPAKYTHVICRNLNLKKLTKVHSYLSSMLSQILNL